MMRATSILSSAVLAGGLLGAVVLSAGTALADTPPVITPDVPSDLQVGATDTLTPVLSGLVVDQNDAEVTGQIFLTDSAGNAVVGSPTATGVLQTCPPPWLSAGAGGGVAAEVGGRFDE